jgi:hypothetical protein
VLLADADAEGDVDVNVDLEEVKVLKDKGRVAVDDLGEDIEELVDKDREDEVENNEGLVGGDASEDMLDEDSACICPS